jgi:secondary thiamine-phosphate synthase enzyme
VTIIAVETKGRQEIVDVTAQVAAAVAASGLLDGLCHLFVPHTTAGLAINENADPDVKRDLLHALDRLVTADPAFRHAEGNSPAHVKSVLCGSSATLFVTEGHLELGSWGGVYFCEFDGPRRRRLLLRAQGRAADGTSILT